MDIIFQNEILDRILEKHRLKFGKDYPAYKNHCYRVFNLAVVYSDKSSISLDKIAIACAFHDLAIWVHQTFDYIGPSVRMARAYLEQEGKFFWSDEISQMISEHHKVSRCDGFPLAEAFRKADWIDVSIGAVRFGQDRQDIKALYKAFPAHRFHLGLVQLSLNNFIKNPLHPLPMYKW
jgi:hypothetical protein